MTSSAGVKVIQWIVDTRDLWPEASKTAQLEVAVGFSRSPQPALSLIRRN
jgi:hypothetical protein